MTKIRKNGQKTQNLKFGKPSENAGNAGNC